MNTRKLLLPLLGASAILLSGCLKTLLPAVPPQSSTTDPIAEAQYLQYTTSARANSIVNFGGLENDYSVDEAGSHRKFSHRWLAGNGIHFEHEIMDEAKLQARFNEICVNLGGAVTDGGWCVDTATRNYPLFWARTAEQNYRENGVPSTYFSIYAVAPASGKDHTDKLWLAYAKGQGFLGRDEKRAQAKTMLKEGTGIMVCRNVTYGIAPLWRGQDKGYIEDAANKRIKIRIFESVKDRTSYGGPKARKDVNNETVWDRPDNWYICE